MGDYIDAAPDGCKRLLHCLLIAERDFHHGPSFVTQVFDVRFLDNPYFVDDLRAKTGNDGEVKRFVLSSDGAGDIIDHIDRLLRWALPRYRREGKSYLTIAVGCTGGKHRSVVVANEVARRLAEAAGEAVAIVHRDVQKGAIMATVSASRVGDEAPAGKEEGV